MLLIPNMATQPPKRPWTSTPLTALGAPPRDSPSCPVRDHNPQIPLERCVSPLLASLPRAPEEEDEKEEEMSAGDGASMISRVPSSGSNASDPEDSLESLSDPLSAAPPSKESPCPLSPALSSWQDNVSAIKLKFERDMLSPSPRKWTCRTLVSIRKKRILSSVFHCFQCYRNPSASSKRIGENLQSKDPWILPPSLKVPFLRLNL